MYYKTEYRAEIIAFTTMVVAMTTRGSAKGKTGEKTKWFQSEVVIMSQTSAIMVQTTQSNKRLRLIPKRN